MKRFESISSLIVMAFVGISIFTGCNSPQNTNESMDTNTLELTDPPGQSKLTANDSLTDVANMSISTLEEDEQNDATTSNNAAQNYKITVNFKAGQAKGGKAVYAMWLENETRTFIQNLYVCNRLLDGSLTGTALPYWQMNKKNESNIDGVTGATKLPEFSVTRDLEPEVAEKFTVFVELDHSWDGNDWFDDQPALLYAAEIDLADKQSEYTLVPLGWTCDQKKTFSDMTGKPSFEAGELCTEMRYITNTESNGEFGDEDLSSSATNMVDKLTVIVESATALSVITSP